MELGGQKEELSRPDTRLQLQEESWTGKNHQLQVPTGKDVHCVSYEKSTTPATQPRANRHHSELLLFSNGLSFKITTPNFLLLHKILSLVVGLAYGFDRSLFVQNYNSLLFPNKPSFAGKITISFLKSTQFSHTYSTLPLKCESRQRQQTIRAAMFP